MARIAEQVGLIGPAHWVSSEEMERRLNGLPRNSSAG
jgi:hypothetical protein